MTFQPPPLDCALLEVSLAVSRTNFWGIVVPATTVLASPKLHPCQASPVSNTRQEIQPQTQSQAQYSEPIYSWYAALQSPAHSGTSTAKLSRSFAVPHSRRLGVQAIFTCASRVWRVLQKNRCQLSQIRRTKRSDVQCTKQAAFTWLKKVRLQFLLEDVDAR